MKNEWKNDGVNVGFQNVLTETCEVNNTEYYIKCHKIHQESIKIAIEEAGFTLLGLSDNADEAYAHIRKSAPDIVLIDIALPGLMNGNSNIKIILFLFTSL